MQCCHDADVSDDAKHQKKRSWSILSEHFSGGVRSMKRTINPTPTLWIYLDAFVAPFCPLWFLAWTRLMWQAPTSVSGYRRRTFGTLRQRLQVSTLRIQFLPQLLWCRMQHLSVSTLSTHTAHQQFRYRKRPFACREVVCWRRPHTTRRPRTGGCLPLELLP